MKKSQNAYRETKNIPLVQFELGKKYLLSDSGTRNLKKARYYMERASAGGLMEAKTALKAIGQLESRRMAHPLFRS